MIIDKTLTDGLCWSAFCYKYFKDLGFRCLQTAIKGFVVGGEPFEKGLCGSLIFCHESDDILLLRQDVSLLERS